VTLGQITEQVIDLELRPFRT